MESEIINKEVSIINAAEVNKLNNMLADIEPILNKYGFTWETVLTDNCDFGHYNIHISPTEDKQTCDNCGMEKKDPTDNFGNDHPEDVWVI